MISLYKNIKKRRTELGMTQDELAKKLGYMSGKSMIAKIEAGKVDLPQSKIVEFANALHTTPGDLLGSIEEDSFVNEEELARRLLGHMDSKLAAFKLLQDMTEEEAQTSLEILRAYIGKGGKK